MNIALSELVDRDILIDLKNVPGVEDVDVLQRQRQLQNDPEKDWRPGVIQLRDDFTAQNYRDGAIEGGQLARKRTSGHRAYGSEFS